MKVSKSKLAVCMPAYNCENFIEESINSILSQTYSDYAFIITDDCSQDGTVEVIKGIRDDRIILFQNDKNRGAIETRNRMLEYCITNGFTYMAIMDSDDIAYPQRFEKQVRILDEDPALAICGSSMKVERTGGIWRAPLRPNQVKARLIFGNQIPTSTATIRLRYMRQHNLRWDKEYAPCADYHLWYKMLFLHRLRAKNTGDIDMVYKYSPGGISHGSGLERQEKQDTVVKQLILSHFSIDASFDDAMGFMKIALRRSNSVDYAPGFLKIGRQLIDSEKNCPVNYHVLRSGLHNRTKYYFQKPNKIPNYIRLQFIESGLTQSTTEVLTRKIKRKLRKVKRKLLDDHSPDLAQALTRTYCKLKRLVFFK